MERNAQGLEPRPSVGLGVYVFNDHGQLLLGKRKGSHGQGEYAAPGGHLEFGETFEEGVQKEVAEETGLEITAITLFNVDNNLRYVKSNNKHYVTLSFTAKVVKGEPRVLEPEKCESWEWFDLNALPSPLAEYAENSLAKLKNSSQPGL